MRALRSHWRVPVWFDGLMYVRQRPGFPLAQYVEMLWYCDGYQATHRHERVLPNGRFQLIIDLAAGRGASIIVGMRTRYSILETASVRSVIGVVFQPGGARPFFDPPADEFYDSAAPLHEIWGSGSRNLRDCLLEAPGPAARLRILAAELQRRVGEPRNLHGAVQYALEEFGRNPRATGVLEVARDSGFSRRRLTQLFREEVGLTPKLYCRLHRFQQVISRIASGARVNWSQVSLEGGYYDQAHMAHEFREFSGISPGAWLSSKRPFQNHAAID
jgi:AraC-like DNA-binding protein